VPLQVTCHIRSSADYPAANNTWFKVITMSAFRNLFVINSDPYRRPKIDRLILIFPDTREIVENDIGITIDGCL
jgi:hypothetical protein